MISTGVQLKLGKTHGNLMVDVKRSNIKLINRARLIFRSVLAPLVQQEGITMDIDLADDLAIDTLMDACEGSVKTAMVAARWNCSPAEASKRLEDAGGLLKVALA